MTPRMSEPLSPAERWASNTLDDQSTVILWRVLFLLGKQCLLRYEHGVPHRSPLLLFWKWHVHVALESPQHCRVEFPYSISVTYRGIGARVQGRLVAAMMITLFRSFPLGMHAVLVRHCDRRHPHHRVV